VSEGTFRPESVNILGKRYSIEYVDRPSDVDVFRRESLWGQIDYWTRTIRIYDNGRTVEDVLETIMHEVIHGILGELRLKDWNNNEDNVSLLGIGLADVLTRNGWLKL
jgi:hypothetical protein